MAGAGTRFREGSGNQVLRMVFEEPASRTGNLEVQSDSGNLVPDPAGGCVKGRVYRYTYIVCYIMVPHDLPLLIFLGILQ